MLEAIAHQLQRLGRAARPLGWDHECDAEIEGDRAEVENKIQWLEGNQKRDADRIAKLEAGLRAISEQATESLAIMRALEVQSKRIVDRLAWAGEADGKPDGKNSKT